MKNTTRPGHCLRVRRLWWNGTVARLVTAWVLMPAIFAAESVTAMPLTKTDPPILR